MSTPGIVSRLKTRALRLAPDGTHLVSDLVAGMTFAVVSVPQAMAHALLATVNPVLGIYSLMVAVPVGAILTSSVFINVSTTAALSSGLVARAGGRRDPNVISAASRSSRAA